MRWDRMAYGIIITAILACAIYARSEVTTLCHVYWETGNYTKGIASRHSHISTNDVHWMRSHTPALNAPSFTFVGQVQYGWIDLKWCETLGGEWYPVVAPSTQYGGVRRFRVYMHPQSELTERMLASKQGFFKLDTHREQQLVRINMSGFFPVVGGTPVNLNKVGSAITPLVLGDK